MVTTRMVGRLALALLCSLGLNLTLAQGALAAFNQNSSRSNNAKAGVSDGGSETDAIIENMRARLNELEARLQTLGLLSAQIDQELAAIDALKGEISSLSEQARQAQDSESTAAEELLAQYEEAKRTFTDQIASYLDPEVSKAVIAALDGASKEAGQMRSSGAVSVATGDVTGDGFDSSVLTEALDEIRGVADELKKVVEKASSGLKDTLKTQV